MSSRPRATRAPEPQIGAAPQAPERGRLARWLGAFHVTGVFWYRFHSWGVRVAPRWSMAPLVHLFTLFFFLVLWRIRRAVAANLIPLLGVAGPIEQQKRIWRTLLCFAWSLTERYEHFVHSRLPEVEIDDREPWDKTIAAGTGFIVLTAHLGNWEVASAVLANRLERRVHLVREEELTPEAQRFVGQQLERRAGKRIVTHFAGDVRLGVLMAEALRAGEIVALQGDRPRAQGKTVKATLFGREFALPVGPLALARVAGVPVLLVFAFREGRFRYRVTFRGPIRVEASGERSRDLGVAARQVARELEWAISRAPHQWFCFRELWPRHAVGVVSAQPVVK